MKSADIKTATTNQSSLIQSTMQTLAIKISTALLTLSMGHWVSAQPLYVATTGGSLMQIAPDNQTFEFAVLQGDGTTKLRTFKYAEVREFRLIENPNSNLQNEILALVEQLGSVDFTERELAEAKLSEAKYAGRFEKLLRNYRNHPNLEIRYRVRRVLADLVDRTSQTSSQDLLILKSGEHLSGDAHQLTVSGQVLGQKITLERSQIRQLGAQPNRSLLIQKASPVRVKKRLLHSDHFYNNDDDFVFDFESDPFGNSISLNQNLSDSFVSRGLRFSSTDSDYVRAVRFSFKFCPIDAGYKSVCIQGERMFRGVMRIRFCLPGQPDVSAGVTRFGMFIERVDNPRDFVVQAFDANGNLISLVEATNQDCCFAGFQSNVPITEIRVQQNPYLVNSNRTLDEMYAVDNVTFNRPVAVPASSISSILKLRTGDFLAVTKLAIGPQAWRATITELPQSISVEPQEIAWYQTSNPITETPKHWRVLLTDGSVIAGEMGENCPPAPERQPNGLSVNGTIYQAIQQRDDESITLKDVFRPLDDRISIDAKQIVALWPAGKPAIYPEPEDFPSKHPVLVFPGCRILTKNNIFFFRDSMFWPANCQEMLQRVDFKKFESEPEDTSVQGTGKTMSSYDSPTAPSIWFQAPNTLAPQQGHVSTRFGTRYVFGPGGRFVLKSISDDQILLSFRGGDLLIPMKDVSNLSFGQPR
ncbi:MAG: hypothetical protein MK106_08970 [Mariniblastus sp.]|nr:hypothetical protein [Mariniblastus sp.]